MRGFKCPPETGPAENMKRGREMAFIIEPIREGKRAPDAKSLCVSSQTMCRKAPVTAVTNSRDCRHKRVCYQPSNPNYQTGSPTLQNGLLPQFGIHKSSQIK